MSDDVFEFMERAAEARLQEMIQPDGRMRCGCGLLFRPEDGQSISPNPYAMPVCPACFERWLEE